MRLDKDKICIQIDNEHSIVEDKKTFLSDLERIRDMLCDLKLAAMSDDDEKILETIKFYRRWLYLIDNHTMKLTSIISLLDLEESNELYEGLMKSE